MTRGPKLIAACAAVLALIVLAGTALAGDRAGGARSKPVQLDAATLIIEVNGTDGDAGLQFFLDGEPWNSIRTDVWSSTSTRGAGYGTGG
jgi:hypothetical protein